MAGEGNSSLFKSVVPDSMKYSPADAVMDAPMGTTSTIGSTAPSVSLLPPNPAGSRPSAAEHNKNILGIDPATGFARSYFANVGVQYGVNALNTGQITMDQFVDMNRRIGGMDADGNLTAARTAADARALRNAYRSGMVMYGGGGLASTAVLNLDVLNNEAKVVKNKPADLVDGCFGATTPGAPDDFIAEPQTFGGFYSVFRRGNGAPSPTGIVEIAPAPSRCNAMFPASSFPRFEAGESIAGRTLQCQLRPVVASDYAGYAELNPGWTGATQAGDLARISEVFPEGVCDFSKPGVEEQPIAGTWLRVTGPEQLEVRQPLQ